MISLGNGDILDQISSFDGSLARLGRLIAALDAIWVSRTDWPEVELKNFRSDWAVLEQIYAEALDKQSTKLSAQDILDSRVALKAIKEQLIGNAHGL